MTNGFDPSELSSIYRKRFGTDPEARKVLWETLVSDFFQKYVKNTDTVVDVAAGDCCFINSVRANRRIAIDLNPDVVGYVGPGVEVVHARSTELAAHIDTRCDVVFVSNFLEHLDTKHDLLETLRQIRAILQPGGRLLILQPNLRLLGASYWNFVDHSLPITDASLAEALQLCGFAIEEQRTRFLPYTAQGRLPTRALFVRAYLRFRPAQWLLGKQTFVLARPA